MSPIAAPTAPPPVSGMGPGRGVGRERSQCLGVAAWVPAGLGMSQLKRRSCAKLKRPLNCKHTQDTLQLCGEERLKQVCVWTVIREGDKESCFLIVPYHVAPT